MSSSTTSSLGSPRLGGRSTRHNRMTVVVEEKMVKVPTIVVQNPLSREQGSSLDPSARNSVGRASKLSSQVVHPTPLLAEKDMGDQPPTVSSPDSVRSSCSSIVDSISNVSSAVPPSSESRTLEYLQHQISQSAIKLYQLEKKVQDIPKLQCEVDRLEKERTKVANNLLDSQELVKTMKQRISVLHEQNEQLVQLTTAAKTDSSEVMRIRNTLVASLAQLKQLQKQVDTIPGLKAQLRQLADENSHLKEVGSDSTKWDSLELPQGVRPADYQALRKDNEDLRQINAEQLESLARQVHMIASTCDELKLQIENHMSSKPVVNLLQEQVKALENEKDGLYQQVVELRLRGSSCYVDVDTAFLTTEVAELKRENSQLNCQLKQQKVESQLQKEELILKLFELEKLKMTSEQLKFKGQVQEVHRNGSPEFVTDSQGELCDHSKLPESLPVVKDQLLKLDQLKLHYEQSRQIMQVLIAEKEELEKRVEVLSSNLEEHEVTEFQRQLEERETKLKLASQRIGHLEQQLSRLSDTNSELASVVSENEKLSRELTELQCFYEQSLEVIRDLKKIEEQHMQYEAQQIALRKAKEDKRKAEKKYKLSKDKLQSLAMEMSSSAELLKNYQTQCVQLQGDLEVALAENNGIRSEVAGLKADLEVARFERDSHSQVESTQVYELQLLCDELNKKNKHLEGDIKKATHELQEQVKAVKHENATLLKTKALLETRVCELETKNVEYETLQARLSKLENLLDSTSATKKQLEIELEALKDDYDQSSREVVELHAQLDKLNERLEDVLTNELMVSEEGRQKESLLHTVTKEKLQQSTELVLELQRANKSLQEGNHSLNVEVDELKQSLVTKERELHSLRTATSESKRLTDQLQQNKAHTENRIDSLTREKAKLLSKLRNIEELSQVTQLESKLQKVNHELELLHETRKSEKTEIARLRQESSKLAGEVEGYRAMVDRLHERLEEAESREIEHEQLKSKIKKLERLLGDSSHDNKTLVKLLHETVTELPTYSTEASRSLQDENLRLEEQVSVLSQWNDKQRNEIEDLENLNHQLQSEKHQLLLDLTTKEGHMQENLQLKRELKEVEMEINMLRRQARADVHEELQIKIEAQTQLLTVFSQHNDSLKVQVGQLQRQVLSLGGELDKQTPASPPPIPEMLNFTIPSEEIRQRTWSDLGQENLILKQRIKTMEEEVRKLHSMSSSVRRRSTTLHVLSSVPVGTIHEELQVK